jgi:hypothetical protein
MSQIQFLRKAVIRLRELEEYEEFLMPMLLPVFDPTPHLLKEYSKNRLKEFMTSYQRAEQMLGKNRLNQWLDRQRDVYVRKYHLNDSLK